jgi:hypothetical protein
MKRKLLVVGALCSSLGCNASDIGDYVGWTIVAKKTIASYVDKDGNSKEQFDGCDFGRRIVFEDQTYLTCQSYGYQYAYRPTAILLVQGGSWVMVVGDNAYRMRN